MSWIIRSSPVWSSPRSNMVPFAETFPGRSPARAERSKQFFGERVVVIQCSMTQGWVEEKKKEGMIWVETVRLEEKCRGWVEVKEPGAAMRAQVKAKKGAERRKEERCNRNERGTPAVDNWSSDVPTQSERFSTWGYYTTGAQTLKPHYSPRVRTSLFLPLAGAREGGESRAEYLKEKCTFWVFSVHFPEDAHTPAVRYGTGLKVVFFVLFLWHKPTEFEISPVWLIPEPLDKWMLLKLCFRFKIRCRTRNAVQENITTLKMKYSILVENIHNSFDVMMSMCYVTKHANQLAWPFLVQSSHSKGVNTDTSPVLPG